MRSFSEPRGQRGIACAPLLFVMGMVLLLAGMSCVGYVAYQYFGTNAAAEQAVRTEVEQLQDRWQQESPPATSKSTAQTHAKVHAKVHRKTPGKKPSLSVVPGHSFALLRIPAFGDDFEVPILPSIGAKDLSRGVGHYPATAMPGQIGNFAVAGHRITHGQPFARLLDLKKGDKVVVETRAAVYVYVLDVAPRELTVRASAGWVLDPVPGKTVSPTRALLTLTTCQDLYRSRDRSIGFGHLVSTKTKK